MKKTLFLLLIIFLLPSLATSLADTNTKNPEIIANAVDFMKRPTTHKASQQLQQRVNNEFNLEGQQPPPVPATATAPAKNQSK